jgi:hypothetical protein
MHEFTHKYHLSIINDLLTGAKLEPGGPECTLNTSIYICDKNLGPIYTKLKEMLTKMDNQVLLIVNINKNQQILYCLCTIGKNTPLN